MSPYYLRGAKDSDFFTIFVKLYADGNTQRLMNTLDIILLVILVLAGVDGWRHGVIVQLCGIGGLVIGIWLAIHFSHGMEQWLHFGKTFSTVLGFIVILLLSIVVLGVVGFLFKRIFRLTGFGILDNIGGVVLGVLKIGLLFYFIIASFARMNENVEIINPRIITESKVYNTMGKVTNAISPFLVKNKDKLFPTAEIELLESAKTK